MSQPAPQRIAFQLPPLGLDGQTITASNWFAARGARVLEGDRLLEILAGDVIVDLPAPATGILESKAVAEDDRLTTGQLLGTILILPESP